MKKEKDIAKIAENRRILIIVLIAVVLFFGTKQFLKTQDLVGKQLSCMTSAILTTAELLEMTETDLDQHLMWESLSNSLLDMQKTMDAVAKKDLLLSEYAEATDNLAIHILLCRSKYQENQPQLVVKEIQNIAEAIRESGIRDIVTEDGYLYSLDSKGVKDMLQEILQACELEV